MTRSLIASLRGWGEMVKFSHSVFALPFALMAAVMAGTHLPGRNWPYAGQIALIVLCMVAARSVAMTFNRIVDAGIDARNPRTANRHLPAGRLSFTVAYVLLGLFIVTFGIGCFGFYFWYENTWPIMLSGPVLIYLCAYSFAKRFTRWSHFVLGSAIAMSPVAAWLAVDPGSLGIEALLLMLSVAGWIGGFDIIYACQDIEIDRAQGLHSLPSRLGPAAALWIARLAHLTAVSAWIALGVVAGLGSLYAVGVAVAAALLVTEHRLVRPGEYSKINLAFFTINGLVSMLLAAMTIVDVHV